MLAVMCRLRENHFLKVFGIYGGIVSMKILRMMALMIVSFGVKVSAEEVTTKAQQHEGWVDLLEPGGGDFGTEHWRMVNVAEGTFHYQADKQNKGESYFVCTGKPTGLIRTAATYENFLIEFEWRHMERDGMRANAGFFLWSDALPAVAIPFSRSVEVQVCNFDRNTDWFTRHGDVFAIHGAKMTPDPRFARWGRGQRSLPLEFRAKGTGEWNHYRILCVDGTVQLEVNGKVVSGGYHVNPRKGHLMIESEGGEVHFRNMRLLELADANAELPAGSVAATLAADVKVKPLYNGLDLKGWRLSQGAQIKARDWALSAESGEATYSLNGQEGRLIVDWANNEAIETLPVSFGAERAKVKVAKGRHRLEVDLGSGAWMLNGKAQETKLDLDGQSLVLHGLGKKGIFANILTIQQ